MAFKEKLTIFYVDDDADDIYLVKKSLTDLNLSAEIVAVSHGGDLINYLYNARLPKPLLILLDINMPVVNGYQTLEQLKVPGGDFRWIPICIFTTSSDPEDIKRCYHLGANACFSKPTTYKDLSKIMEHICRFWLASATSA